MEKYSALTLDQGSSISMSLTRVLPLPTDTSALSLSSLYPDFSLRLTDGTCALRIPSVKEIDRPRMSALRSRSPKSMPFPLRAGASTRLVIL